MSRRSNRKRTTKRTNAQAPKPTTAAPRPEPVTGARITALMESVAFAYNELVEASAIAGQDMADPDRVMDLSDTQRAIDAVAARLEELAMTVHEAVTIIAEDRPLSSTFTNGSRWAGALSPNDIVRLAELARPGQPSVTYVQGRADAELADATERSCPHGDAAIRVRRADGTRARACWAHLTKEEKAEITAERNAALANPCPYCRAAEGKPCVEDGTKTTIHSARLRPQLVHLPNSALKE